jgi:hypothetical protein
MKYHQIDRNVFIKNSISPTQMKPKWLFNSNDIYPVSADSIATVCTAPRHLFI